jgi:transposase
LFPKVRLPTAVPSSSFEERHQRVITIGIDPHKSSLTAVAVEPNGLSHPPLRVVVDGITATALLAWALQWPDRQWAVEGATGLGRGIAQQLVTAGETVLDVPAKLAARARLLGSSNARKTDVTDAASVAAVAQHNRRLNRVQIEDHTTILRLLTERRDDLVAEHTRGINRLHVLLRDLHPGGAEIRLDSGEASALLSRIRPITAADRQRKHIAREVVRDLKRHEASIKELEKELRAAVTASGTTLTQIQGIGFLTAAKILALTGDIRRFPNQEHYASYTGTAPIDVSSGEQETHRLSPTRQPPTQRRHPRRRCYSGARSRPGPRPLPTQAHRTQDPQRGPPESQTTPVEHHLPPHPGRPPTHAFGRRLTHRGALEPLRPNGDQDRAVHERATPTGGSR